MNIVKSKNVFVPILMTVAVLVFIEGISRVVLSRIYNRSFDSSLIEEHKYGPSSGLRSDASGIVWGQAFHTDEMGARRQTKKKPGKPKLLVIGDSVTEGVGVNDTSTFADLFNNGQNSKPEDDRDIRNISLIGWSASDYRNVIDNLVGKDTTIKDVCLFYCLNDIYGTTPVKDLPVMGNKGFISTVNAFLQDKYATYKLVKVVMYQNLDRYYQYDQAFYKDTAMVKAVMADLVHMKQVCDSHNVTFAVFMVPYRSQLMDRTKNLPQKVMTMEMAKNGIPFLDLLPRWPHRENYKDLYLFADEIHLSIGGHSDLLDAISQKQ